MVHFPTRLRENHTDPLFAVALPTLMRPASGSSTTPRR